MCSSDLNVSEQVKVMTKENGEELLPTEQNLADTIEVLNLVRIVRLMEETKRDLGGQLPMLDAVVQVAAANDRFVGRESEELGGVLKRLTRKGLNIFERVDISGGHISTLMKRQSVIVPAIVTTFSKFSEGVEEVHVEAPQCMNRM